jgi:hypothetical protein
MKYLSLIGLSLAFFLSEVNAQHNYRKTKRNAPGIVFISDTLACDVHEVTNIDWLFYLHSSKKSYSMPFRPDETVWENSGYPHLTDVYFENPLYRNHPVVGIDLFQAMGYAKWRTKAVLLGRLFRQGVLKKSEFDYYSDQELDVFLTDFAHLGEKYEYFEYRIPSFAEWEVINEKLEFYVSDKPNGSRRFKAKSRRFAPYVFQETSSVKAEESFFVNAPVRSVYGAELHYSGLLPIFDFKGNVAEIIRDKPIAYGGSWKDSRDTPLPSGLEYFKRPNAWTGFRCVGSWKKWNP